MQIIKINMLKKKPLLTSLTILFVILLCVVGYIIVHNKDQSNAKPATGATGTVNYKKPTAAEENLQNQIKQSVISKSTDTNQTPSNITVSISRISQAGAGQDIQIRAVISGTTSGTCTVTFTKDTDSFSESFTVVQQATYSTCNSANVPAASFPTKGVWNVSIKITNGQSVSNTAESSINVT